jgi:membrane associated rhomboid family serine protease
MQREKRRKVIDFSRLNILIAINVIVYLIVGVVAESQKQTVISQTLFSYIALPSSLPLLFTRFWTVFSFMFLYNGFLNLIFGMLWLYWVGQIFEDFLGSDKVLTLYLVGGLGAALFFLLGYNLFPYLATSRLYAAAAGGPACVMAVVVGTATLVPDYSVSLLFFGTTSLKRVVMIYVVLDLLFSNGPYGNEAITHIGGGLAGFIYVKQLQRGNNIGAWFENLFKPKSKLTVAARNSTKNTSIKPRQDEIDRILDKISQTGYDSLSTAEKEILFRASNDDKS